MPRPSPEWWDNLTTNETAVVVGVDWGADLKGASVRAATSAFVSVESGGPTFSGISETTTRSLAQMSGVGVSPGVYNIRVKATNDDTGEVMEIDPPIKVRVVEGGTY